ncbi:hypothetical protein AB0J82_01495 [Asanoa sp. NPDC049518]|uniref:hypothetical protein n=1 Tax=unclassified Asanoa TaxID=2685164 RepID=UPI0034156D5C
MTGWQPAARAPITAASPMPPEAEHRRGGAGPGLCGVDDRADAGEQGTAEQRRPLQRQRAVDRYERLRRRDGVLAERGDAEMVVHLATGPPERPSAA